MLNKKICFSSIDVEHDRKTEGEFEGVECLDGILELFKKYEISATLFVTGNVLEKYADLIKKWSGDYEISCHTYNHRFWNTLSFEERQKDLEKYLGLYRDIFQREPLGFRAPSHIIDQEGIRMLEEEGFLYDSSIIPHFPPFKKYRGYKGRAPLTPYHPEGRKILEIPVRGQFLGIPLAGAWILGLPVWFYKVLFAVYGPDFVTLSMHSWDALNSKYLKKLEKILEILKKEDYQFYNGKQVFENQ